MNRTANETACTAERRAAFVLGDANVAGATIGRRLADEDFRVAVAGIGRPPMREAASTDTRYGAIIPIDVEGRHASRIRQAIERAVEHLGVLDVVVVHVDPLCLPPGTPLMLGDLELQLGLDVRGVYDAIHGTVAHLRDGGRIVTVCGGAMEWSGANAAVMAMLHAAIASLVKGLALDLAGRRIAINHIQSGPADASLATTYASLSDGRAPLGWIGKPHETAALVAYLASGASGPMTGATITIDGGFAL
jgi:3-oxoacyl-[acyl-carrier protein] reductase